MIAAGRVLLLSLCLFLLPLMSHSISEGCTKPKNLFIQGFVPALNDVYTSEGIIPAAELARKEINNNSNLLPDFCLVLNFSNTMCDASEATWQLIQSILNYPDERKIFFLGGGCAPATEPLAALSGRFYNLTQISYGSSTPTLSDRNMFPRFFRTIPSETQSNSARFAVMMKYNWTRVATLHETQNVFSLTVGDFHSTYARIYNNATATDDEEEDEDLILRSFTDDPEIPLRQIKEKDIRIILGYFYQDKARPTICQAYHMGLTTHNHLWMFPAWYDIGWWNVHVGDNSTDESDQKSCTPEQMREAVQYSFLYDSYHLGDNPNATTFSGINVDSYNEAYEEELSKFNTEPQFADFRNPDGTEAHVYGTFTYDAMYAIAIALNKSERYLQDNGGISLIDFDYPDNITVPADADCKNAQNAPCSISDVIKKFMDETNLAGISGQVTFDENGTREGINVISQLRDCDPNAPDYDPFDLCVEQLAIHNPKTADNEENFDFEYILEPLWKGGSPPQDRRTPKNIYLDQGLIYACDVLVTIAIIIAIGLFVFNLVTIRKPLIADSAPFINMIIILGCIIMLGTCYLLGIDSATPKADDYVEESSENTPPGVLDDRNDRYIVVCTARLWLLTIGFTLSFGALFAKTWQVYRVYTDPKKKQEPFKMWNFLILMGVFLTIDVVYLSIWTGAFPFERGIQTDEDDSADVVENYEECDCENFGYLIGALYVYKGLLVVFGLFLAYESRNVKYIHINDSRFVSIAMYIVVILVGIGAPLSLVLAVHVFIDPAYSLAVFMIIAACMSCLLILYVPKFIYMSKGLDTMVRENSREEVTVSDGLQLGRSTVDQTDVRTAEDEVNDLRQQVAERNTELDELESMDKSQIPDDPEDPPMDTTVMKPRAGSDGDSGVLVTGDDNENEAFSSESTDQQRVNSTTPTTAEPPEVTEL